MAQCKKDEKKKKNWKKRSDETEQQNFFLLRLELLIKQQTNKRKAATTNRFLYTYYIHTYIYIRKEALVAFTVLDKWGFKLEDQKKTSGKKETILYVHWQTFFLFPSFSYSLPVSLSKRRSAATEVSISNNRTANLSPLRDQRTKHFYCSEQ